MPTYGPRSTSAYENDAGVGTAWLAPGSAAFSDNIYANVNLVGIIDSIPSKYLKSSSFGFVVSANETIVGMLLEVERKQQSGANIVDNSILPYSGGVIISTATDHADGVNTWPTIDGFASYGGATDLWGVTWTPALINAGGFGFGVSAVNSALTRTAFIDFTRVTIYTTAPSGFSGGPSLMMTGFGT